MMSGSMLVVTIGISWVAIGVVLSIVMGRRGHNSFGWFVVGAVLGPLAVVLAADAWRRNEKLEPEAVQLGVGPGGGAVDVLVGFDDSPDCLAAAEAVVALLGNRLGRMTAVTVVAYGAGEADEAKAADALRRFAAGAPGRGWELEVLHGHPAEVLGEYATAQRYDLIAAGTRGAGITKAILGSAASALARHSTVPVLLAGTGAGTPERARPMSPAAQGAVRPS